MTDLVTCLRDKNLLGQFIENLDTFRTWFTFHRAKDALPPEPGDMEIFQRCTGRTEWPTEPAKEIAVIVGRQSGKTLNTGFEATYCAAVNPPRLKPHERVHTLVVSPTRQQSQIIKRYVSGFFNENPILKQMVLRENQYGIQLSTGVNIDILASDFKSVRGFRANLVVVEEAAFMYLEGGRSDVEIVRALRPTLATTGGRLILISSPHGKRGALYDIYKNHFGVNGSPTLVWQADSRTMNPTLDEEFIDRAIAEDPEGGQSEWKAIFRSDLESYVSRDVVESCIIPGRVSLPPMEDVRYSAFVDVSGGSQDSMTLGIKHTEEEIQVLDVLLERKPPFSPDQVVEEFAQTLRLYRVTSVEGDRYGGEWPRERFERHGIRYNQCPTAKSGLYQELLPLLNAGRCELLDSERLVHQLCTLERRTSRGGRDSIDHPPGGHDDLANAVAGAFSRGPWQGSVFEGLDMA